jgi:lipooligosaccharide transport system ATP-binding protein
MSYFITAKDLTKKFNDFTAVDGITFNINEGECFGILGPNGAGKTSTVKMINCVSPVTSGELKVDGNTVSVDSREIRKITGVMPQEVNLDNDLTVYENLIIFSQFFDIPKAVGKKRIKELLKFIELETKANNRIDELSTGMKRRLLIARALINEPKLIIADEPTTGLDPQARHLIWQRLRQLKLKGVTLILTTQYMEEAEQLCDRLVIMYKGKVLKEGVPKDLIEKEIGREVIEIRAPKEEDDRLIGLLSGFSRGYERVGDTLYFYCTDGHDLMKKLVELNLTNYFNRPASLEDVFLKLTGRSLLE